MIIGQLELLIGYCSYSMKVLREDIYGFYTVPPKQAFVWILASTEVWNVVFIYKYLLVRDLQCILALESVQYTGISIL